MLSLGDVARTWGYEFIRSLDTDDVDRALRALEMPGAYINSQVLESLGYYKWTPWIHLFHGDTPMHLAIKFKRENIVRALLSLNPDLSIRNSKNKSPADICEEYLGVPLAKILKEEEEGWARIAMERRKKEIEDEIRSKKQAKIDAMVNRATAKVDNEAKTLLLHRKVMGVPYLGSEDELQQDVMARIPDLPDDSALKHVLLTLDHRKAVTANKDLRYEKLGEKGLRRLCEALTTNKTVKELELGNSRLGTPAIQHVADMLSRNTSITRLDLHGNCIDDQGAAVLSQVVERNPRLKEVVLSGNRISDVGAQSLVAAAKKVSKVSGTTLVMSNNKLSPQCFRELAQDQGVVLGRAPWEWKKSKRRPMSRDSYASSRRSTSSSPSSGQRPSTTQGGGEAMRAGQRQSGVIMWD